MKKDKRIAHVGSLEVDIADVVRDPRGNEDMIQEIVENDFVEGRHSNFGGWITLLPDAADVAEQDYSLLDRYPPLYTKPQGTCTDCASGPCELKKADGKCGLTMDSLQGRLSLRKACRGCMTQMVASRQLFNHARKRWPEDTPVSMGEILNIQDRAPAISVLTGINVTTLKDVGRALSYAEEQLAKLFQASYTGTCTATEFESMVLHAGSVLLVAMGVAEMLKISLFGFITAASQSLDKIEQFPPATLAAGWASVEAGKPVLAFVGDDCLPAWFAIDRMKQGGLTEKIEICGILTAEAERAGSKALWVAPHGVDNLPDSTDEPVGKIVDALLGGTKAVWIRDIEKAAEVAVMTVQKVKRGPSRLISDDEAAKQAKGHKQDCDLCTAVCPVNLPVAKAVRQLGQGDWAGFYEVEKGCNFCGRCEAACPSKVQLRDIIVAAERKQASKDKFIMRPGRGPISITELLQSAFAVGWGSIPAMVTIFGCGDAHKNEIAWFVAGCAGAEVARSFSETKKKHLFEQYPTTCASRNIVNCGSCSAICHAVPMYLMLRPSGGIPLYGSIPPLGDSINLGGAQSVIVWGSLPDRMYAVAAAWARLGSTVIVGPASSLEWTRYLVGTKYDRSILIQESNPV
ncbi:MAG: hypothetical protein NTU41_08035, partial [Chloroflexi bacterium]|nr:hypothetical protein [Chloroflexota bacterium]